MWTILIIQAFQPVFVGFDLWLADANAGPYFNLQSKAELWDLSDNITIEKPARHFTSPAKVGGKAL